MQKDFFSVQLNLVAELVKSFEYVNEILDGFRYKNRYPYSGNDSRQAMRLIRVLDRRTKSDL